MVKFSISESNKLLSEMVSLAAEYSWIYDYHAAHTLTCGVLNCVPSDWLPTLSDLSTEQLNDIANCESEDSYPDSLKEYLTACGKLSIHSLVREDTDKYNGAVNNKHLEGVCPKKSHEILRLCNLVSEVSEKTHSSNVLDVGSGLGYVDSMIHHLLFMNVLGLESQADRVKKAKERHTKLCGSDCHKLNYQSFELKEDFSTVQRISGLVDELCNSSTENCQCASARKTSLGNNTDENQLKLNLARNSDSVNKSVVLLGLHSCADLSPLMMRIFFCCQNISALVLLSCCYHKMKELNCTEVVRDTHVVKDCDCFTANSRYGSDSDNASQNGKKTSSPVGSQDSLATTSEECEDVSNGDSAELPVLSAIGPGDSGALFKNFPLSQTLASLMCAKQFVITSYGLRAACQEPGVRWRGMSADDHTQHQHAMLYRAVLHKVCSAENAKLVKMKRRGARKHMMRSFDTYLESVRSAYQFQYANNTSSTLDHVVGKLRDCYESSKHLGNVLEGLSALQLAIQGVLEAIVLLDRVVYAMETKYCSSVEILNLCDARISPRCFSLVLYK